MPESGWLRRLAWGEERKWRRLWAVSAVAAGVAIAVGSLTPGSEMPSSLPWDKLNHFVGYGGLAGLIGLAGLALVRTLIAVMLFGIGIEFLQLAVPGRSGGDWADILANSLGALAAVLVLAGFRRYLLHR